MVGPIVSIVVPFFVHQKLYYRILTIKLVNQKKELQWRLQGLYKPQKVKGYLLSPEVCSEAIRIKVPG